MIRSLFITLCIFSVVFSNATTISGNVKDKNGNALASASIQVKGTSIGVITNVSGNYTLRLDPGHYTLICQYIGFKREEKNIIVGNQPLVVNFELSIQEITMQEVIVQRGPDPALEIIREAIKKRDYYNNQVDSFQVDVYIKGMLRSRKMPDKVFGQKVEKKELQKSGFDSLGRGILFLSESQTKVSFKKPGKYKYDVISSRQAGGGYGFSFPFFINFYTNNVEVFKGINTRGFISPIADNAFHYYKFHYEGSFSENGKIIDRIKVSPRRKNEPLFEGYVQIVDQEWRIHSLDLQLRKENQLELMDTANIRQIQAQITADIWKTQNQVVYVAGNTMGFEWTGNFLNVYSNYNLNPGFNKNTFKRTLIAYDTAFNKRDTAFWNSVRPFSLDAEEQKDFKFKDSMYAKFRDSFYTKRNLDSLNKRQQPITVNKLLLSGIDRHRYSTRGFFQYQLDPLLFAASFNSVEGLTADLNQSFRFSPRKGKNEYYIEVDTRYGFSNHHFNAFGLWGVKPKKNYFNRYLELSAGKRVSQFNHDNPIDPLINTLYTLIYKENYMKLYENWFGQLEYNGSLDNGLKFNFHTSYEDRLPVVNSTNFSFGKTSRTFLPNHPYELAGIPFERHQAWVASVALSFQPGQRFIELPDAKIAVASKYPTFELLYAKGIRTIFSSDVDFDKWKLSVSDHMNLKIGGEFRYRLAIGGFLNAAQVGIPDYQHFNGNQTFLGHKYLNSFQLAPYYRYSNIEKLFSELHVEHHFNGLLTNKIPVLNKMKWNLVAGSNDFYVSNNKYYAEAFVGLENILKVLRVDFLWSYQSLPGNNWGVRVGRGGTLGNLFRLNRKK